MQQAHADQDAEGVLDLVLKVNKSAIVSKPPEHFNVSRQRFKQLFPEAADVTKLAPPNNGFIGFGQQVYIATTFTSAPLRRLETSTNCSLESCKFPLKKGSNIGLALVYQDIHGTNLGSTNSTVCAHHVFPSFKRAAIPHANRISAKLFLQDTTDDSAMGKSCNTAQEPENDEKPGEEK